MTPNEQTRWHTGDAEFLDNGSRRKSFRKEFKHWLAEAKIETWLKKNWDAYVGDKSTSVLAGINSGRPTLAGDGLLAMREMPSDLQAAGLPTQPGAMVRPVLEAGNPPVRENASVPEPRTKSGWWGRRK